MPAPTSHRLRVPGSTTERSRQSRPSPAPTVFYPGRTRGPWPPSWRQTRVTTCAPIVSRSDWTLSRKTAKSKSRTFTALEGEPRCRRREMLSNIEGCYLGESGGYEPIFRENIGHPGFSSSSEFSRLNRFEGWTENPRVGGSIPPLATNNIKEIKVRLSKHPEAGVPGMWCAVERRGPSVG
jgi:hypothetical protein